MHFKHAVTLNITLAENFSLFWCLSSKPWMKIKTIFSFDEHVFLCWLSLTLFSILVVFYFGHLLFWSFSILIIFYFGCFLFWSVSILVVFHFGRLFYFGHFPVWSCLIFLCCVAVLNAFCWLEQQQHRVWRGWVGYTYIHIM